MVVIATLLSLIKKVHPLHVLIAGAVFGGCYSSLTSLPTCAGISSGWFF